MTENTCNECNGNIIKENNKKFCENCGVIIDEEMIDYGAEWRSFSYDEEQKKSRVGLPTSVKRHDKGLTTTIDWKDKDAYGNNPSANKKRRLNRLREWNKRAKTKDSGERNLLKAFTEIERMKSQLDLSDAVAKQTCSFYRKALDKDIIKGRSIEAIATVLLYISTRKLDSPRPFANIVSASRVELKEIRHCYKYIKQELNITTEPIKPGEFVNQIISYCNLSNETEKIAREIISAGHQLGINSGKSSIGIASSAVYVASQANDEEITKTEISQYCGVTQTTIRQLSRQLQQGVIKNEF